MENENTVILPCRIGDTVWAIRSYNGRKIPQKGIVSEMFFCDGMKLCIVVRRIARGEWGKTVFPTKEDAKLAIKGRGK